VVFFFALPDGPETANWLTQPERTALLSRIQRDDSHGTSAAHESMGPAFRDPRIWLLGIFNFCMLGSAYAYSFSAPTIVQGLSGLSVTGTGFIIAAMYLLGAVAMFVNAILSDRGHDTFRYVIPGCLMMSVGFLAIALSSNAAVALTGLLVLIVGHMSMQGPFWSISTRFLKGRAAAAGIAFMNMIGITGGFVGPYWMGIARDLTGNYRRGLLTMAVPMFAGAGIMLYLRWRSRQSPSGMIRPAAASA
jgi:ACS family tartrate transporter-like MFS transporter